MLKASLVFILISFVGFKSWSGKGKPRKSTGTGKLVPVSRAGKGPLTHKKSSSEVLTSDLAIRSELRVDAQEAIKKIEKHLVKAGPKLLSQKQDIFNQSKQILRALKDHKSDKESIELLVGLTSKQSLSMMSVKSKKQIENFQFLLNSINSKLVSSSVVLKDILKEATEEYVVARKKVSKSDKESEGRKFLFELKKLCK